MKTQRELIIEAFSKMIEETIEDAYERINEKSMSFGSVKAYISHLPIIGISEGYPKKVYIDVLQCLNRMWKYSLAMGYTKEKSLILFLENDIHLKNIEGWNKAVVEIKKILDDLNNENSI